MNSIRAPKPPIPGAVILVCGVLFGTNSVQAALWAQMGGGFAGDGRLAAVVGQSSPAGGDSTLVAGFLAHPLWKNLPPLAADTSIDAVAGRIAKVAVSGDDVDGRIVSARIVRAASHGSVSVVAKVLDYLAVSGYAGRDSVGFQLLDDQGAPSDTAWVRFSVTGGVSALAGRPAVRKVGSPQVRMHRLMAHAADAGMPGGLALGGRRDDGTGISVSLLLSGPSAVHVQIYDNLGALVTFAETTMDDGQWRALPPTDDGRRDLSVRWDLRDRSGRAVGPGIYLWKISIVSKDGQKLETVRKTGVKQ